MKTLKILHAKIKSRHPIRLRAPKRVPKSGHFINVDWQANFHVKAHEKFQKTGNLLTGFNEAI